MISLSTPRSRKSPHACGVDDDAPPQVPNVVPSMGHFNQALLDHFWRAPKFFTTNPYRVGTKRNPQTRQLIYYLTSVQDVPARIAAIAGEVLQALRSALDHLAYALFRAGPGGTSGSPAKH